MWLNILLIAIAIVIITDLSGVVDYIKRHLYHWMTGNYNYPETWDTPIIHLMSCSLCQTWWCGLIYLIVIGQVTFASIAYLLAIAYLTTTIRDLIVLIKEVLTKIIDKIFKLL
jgi:hypothetical protein